MTFIYILYHLSFLIAKRKETNATTGIELEYCTQYNSLLFHFMPYVIRMFDLVNVNIIFSVRLTSGIRRPSPFKVYSILRNKESADG